MHLIKQTFIFYVFSASGSRRLRNIRLDETEKYSAENFRTASGHLVHANHRIAISFYVLHESTVAQHFCHAIWLV